MNIRQNIFHIFQSDGQTDESFGHACLESVLGGQFAMGGGRRMGDQGTGIAQVGGDGGQLESIDEAMGLLPGFQFEAQDATEAAHLFFGDGALWIAGETGITDPSIQFGMGGENLRNLFGVVTMIFHP